MNKLNELNTGLLRIVLKGFDPEIREFILDAVKNNSSKERALMERCIEAAKKNLNYRMTYDNNDPNEIREMKLEWEPKMLELEDALNKLAIHRKRCGE